LNKIKQFTFFVVTGEAADSLAQVTEKI